MATTGKQEAKTTEFWALIGAAIIWYLDRKFGGGDLLAGVDLGQVDAVKAQVIAIAAEYRSAANSMGNDGILIAGLVIYAGRKLQKIIGDWRGGR